MFDHDIDSADGQLAWHRARPTSKGGGLEGIKWVHRLEGKSLTAVSYDLVPNLE